MAQINPITTNWWLFCTMTLLIHFLSIFNIWPAFKRTPNLSWCKANKVTKTWIISSFFSSFFFTVRVCPTGEFLVKKGWEEQQQQHHQQQQHQQQHQQQYQQLQLPWADNPSQLLKTNFQKKINDEISWVYPNDILQDLLRAIIKQWKLWEEFNIIS